MSDSNHFDNTYNSSYNSYSNPRGVKYYKPSSTSSVASSSWTSWSSSSSSSNSRASLSNSRPVVYTDGCCTKNGRNGARAGIGVYWGPENTRYMSVKMAQCQHANSPFCFIYRCDKWLCFPLVCVLSYFKNIFLGQFLSLGFLFCVMRSTGLLLICILFGATLDK